MGLGGGSRNGGTRNGGTRDRGTRDCGWGSRWFAAGCQVNYQEHQEQRQHRGFVHSKIVRYSLEMQNGYLLVGRGMPHF